MTSASGQPFSCTIPNVQIEQERLEREKEEQAKEETEEDLKATIDRGLDLIEPLGKSCIRFFASVRFLRKFFFKKKYSEILIFNGIDTTVLDL